MMTEQTNDRLFECLVELLFVETLLPTGRVSQLPWTSTHLRFVFGFESRGGEGRRGVAVIVLYRLYRVEIASLLLRNK